MTVKQMNRSFAQGITAVFVVLPLVILIVLLSVLISFSVALKVAALCVGLYLAFNVNIIEQQHWQVVERFGQLYDVKLRGLRFYCLLGIVDKIKASGTLFERKVQIFVDASEPDNLEKLEFEDGAAPVEAYMWYKNARPNGSNEEIRLDIIAYVYTNEDPEDRVVQIAEDRLRPKFEELTLDEAYKKRADVVNGVKEEIAREIQHYGVYFSQDPPIVMDYIGITPEEAAMRQRRLSGQTTADEIASEAEGYVRAIQAMMYPKQADGSRAINKVCSFKEATRIWSEQMTRKMLEKTSSNVTVFANSGRDIVPTFSTNPKERRLLS
jgi:regulator of protease activity HflC (stomatin/prohibitin superfamily)